MIIQKFKMHCESCGKEVVNQVGILSGDNEIIVEFMDGMEFECECGVTTCIDIETYTV